MRGLYKFKRKSVGEGILYVLVIYSEDKIGGKNVWKVRGCFTKLHSHVLSCCCCCSYFFVCCFSMGARTKDYWARVELRTSLVRRRSKSSCVWKSSNVKLDCRSREESFSPQQICGGPMNDDEDYAEVEPVDKLYERKWKYMKIDDSRTIYSSNNGPSFIKD